MITNKIVLGSANINHFYGLNKNKIEGKKFLELMNYVYQKGVKIIDTSPSYKNSEKVIGLSKKKFKIISKIPKAPKNLKKNDLKSWIIKKIINSKKKTKKKIYGILVQNAEILLSKNSDIIFNTLLNLKSKGYFNKIGISIYDFKTLELVIKKFTIDFVQLPYNVLDQRLANKKIIRIIKKNKVEIHARSIFLQGLLTTNKINLPKNLSKLQTVLNKWRNWLKEKNVNPVHACLDFAISNKNIDKLVVGFNSKNNFEDILKFKKTKLNFNSFKLKINQKLIDPRKW